MIGLADPRLRIAGAVALAVLVLDRVTKTIVEHTMAAQETIPLLPFFSLSHVRNTGAAFGIFAGAPAWIRLPLFLGITAVAIAALVSLLRSSAADRPWVSAALGGILGGALGNLVCRLRYGEVIDFLDVHWGDLHWPAFNVADSAITVGVLIVLFASLHDREGAAGERGSA